MNYELQRLAKTLAKRRKEQKLTQAEFAIKVDLPQGHISRIERGLSDVRTSSLIELARVLGFELMLVPKEYVPAVLALVGNTLIEEVEEPAYSLKNVEDEKNGD